MSNKKIIQIDVLHPHKANRNFMACNLYTGDRCVAIYMTNDDYENLVRDGFFIRDGKSIDSAGVANTTVEYVKK